MRRTVAIVVAGPVLVAVLGLVVFLAIRPELPDPVATHWGRSGPNGFTSLRWVLVPVLLGPAIGLLLGAALAWAGRREPVARKAAAGLGTGAAAFVTAVVVGSLWLQRGLDDAARAPGVDGVLVVALLVGVLLGTGAALAVPTSPAGSAGVPGGAAESGVSSGAVRGPRMELAPGERAVWSAWTGAPAAVAAVPALALVPLLVLAALGVAPAYLLLVVVLLAVVVGGSLCARVWVDRRGLTVRGPLGFPAYTVALAEIAAVDVVAVAALREYGGWGWRLGRRGRFGAVFRSGEALQVTRGDGRRFVVTVDGAADAAALAATDGAGA